MTTAPCPVSDEELWEHMEVSSLGGPDRLQEHITGCPDCKARLVDFQRVRDGLESLSTHVPEPVPETVGPYHVKRVIGHGAMGVVYEAEQANPKRRVAVKVLRPARALDDHALRSFRREVAALARLHHPAIASIHDAGQTDAGQPYFAMQLVEGRSIDRHVSEIAADQRVICALLIRVTRAVEFAHRRGILHRDLKPAHIVVDERGDPHVLDFGLASPLHDDAGLSLSLSGARLVGTLAYMSPEQVRADGAMVDARSDVYALGVILYELLTGSPPYDVPSNVVDAAHTIQERCPEHPSDTVDGVSRELGEVVLKALEKEPGRRYATAGAFADDLVS